MATMSGGKFIMAAGGWPIRIGGATIGGIGVSGGNAPGRDDEIARAGLGAVEAMLPATPAQPAPSYPNPAPAGPPIGSNFQGSSMPSSANRPMQPNEFSSPQLNTRHLAPEQEDGNSEDSFHQSNIDRLGGQ
jgi:hypothetical protein